jgi:hypothetical protein
MLKRILILLVLALAQIGCTTEVNEEVGFYKPVVLSPESRQGWERLKREFLQLEEIKIGDGPVAAWGRKVSADIDVRYTDGTVVYRGSSFVYWGLKGTMFIHNSIEESGALALEQTGIISGLNGMAVGGERQITVSPNLVCYGGAIGESTSQGANPNANCLLVSRSGKEGANVKVRKETLIVKATLTASCIPVFAGSRPGGKEVRCRDSKVPQREPSSPIWRFYYALPSHS